MKVVFIREPIGYDASANCIHKILHSNGQVAIVQNIKSVKKINLKDVRVRIREIRDLNSQLRSEIRHLKSYTYIPNQVSLITLGPKGEEIDRFSGICFRGLPIPKKEAVFDFRIKIPKSFFWLIEPFYSTFARLGLIPDTTTVNVYMRRKYLVVSWRFPIKKHYSVSTFYIYISNMRMLREEPAFIINFLTLVNIFNMDWEKAIWACKPFIFSPGHNYFPGNEDCYNGSLKEYISQSHKLDNRPFINPDTKDETYSDYGVKNRIESFSRKGRS